MGIFQKIFGSRNQRELRKLQPIVDRINHLEPTFKAKSDEELRAMTPEFKRRLDKGATLDELLPEAFAVVREASVRRLGMRHYDVQLIGGMVLHQGRIAEMRTGEGKTLVATLPTYLNALNGQGVHVVTVNDYLAKRDAEWMGRIHGHLGLTTGVIVLSTLLVLPPVFSVLPKPVLAALIIEAVVMGMMDVPEMRRLARVQRFDFWIAVAAIAATLLVGVLAGVIIGIGLSLIWLIFVATHPPMPVLAREPGTQVFRELDEHPGDEQFAGVTVLRLDGGLFFATADALEDRVREVALSAPGSTAIVLDCGGMDFIDSQGSAKMSEILNLTKQAGVTLRLARLKPPVREVLERDGVLGRIGDDKIHGNVDHAVNAQLAVSGGHHADCE